jgi:hypothetical protein
LTGCKQGQVKVGQRPQPPPVTANEKVVAAAPSGVAAGGTPYGSDPSQGEPASGQTSMLGPWLDTMGVGGLAIIALLALLAFRPSMSQADHWRLILILSMFLNWPQLQRCRAQDSARGLVRFPDLARVSLSPLRRAQPAPHR